MALSKVDLAGILECKICLDTFYKPKHLNCGHAYCKDCLDGVLVFQDDGSAELKCPLRCSKTTIVDQHETTSSLANVYTLTDLLDKMSVGGKVKYLCQQSKKCKQIISYSCTTCSAKICDKCQNMHSCVNKSVTNISFNEKLQQLQPLCKQHNSLAKFVCIDCENLFVCVYCTHRQHKNHRTKSIPDFGLEAKQWFQSFITSFDETKIILENLTRKYDDALKHVQKEREIFALKIKERKFKRIEEYINMLNREEADLLKIFDGKSKEFKAKSVSASFVVNAIIKEFTDYVQGFNLKSHFELVAEKLEIERQLRRLSSLPKTIPTFYSHLHQMNKEDHFTNPLGKMEISLRGITTVGINSSEFSVYKNVIDECESQPDHSQLVTDLMNLVESLKEYEKPTANAIQASAKELKIDFKPRSLQLAKKWYSFEGHKEGKDKTMGGGDEEWLVDEGETSSCESSVKEVENVEEAQSENHKDDPTMNVFQRRNCEKSRRTKRTADGEVKEVKHKRKDTVLKHKKDVETRSEDNKKQSFLSRRIERKEEKEAEKGERQH